MLNIHVLPRNTWFSVDRMVKKPEVFFAIWANRNQLRFKVATASSSIFQFIVHLFACGAHIKFFLILFYT